MSLTFFICSYLNGQNWIYIGKSSDGSSYYMRSTSVSNSYTKKVWVKHSSSKLTVKKNGKTYTYVNAYEVLLYEFSCTNNQIKLHSVVTYNSKGTVVDSYNPPDYYLEWKDVVPDSVGEMLLEKACELF